MENKSFVVMSKDIVEGLELKPFVKRLKELKASNLKEMDELNDFFQDLMTTEEENCHIE